MVGLHHRDQLHHQDFPVILIFYLNVCCDLVFLWYFRDQRHTVCQLITCEAGINYIQSYQLLWPPLKVGPSPAWLTDTLGKDWSPDCPLLRRNKYFYQRGTELHYTLKSTHYILQLLHSVENALFSHFSPLQSRIMLILQNVRGPGWYKKPIVYMAIQVWLFWDVQGQTIERSRGKRERLRKLLCF